MVRAVTTVCVHVRCSHFQHASRRAYPSERHANHQRHGIDTSSAWAARNTQYGNLHGPLHSSAQRATHQLPCVSMGASVRLQLTYRSQEEGKCAGWESSGRGRSASARRATCECEGRKRVERGRGRDEQDCEQCPCAHEAATISPVGSLESGREGRRRGEAARRGASPSAQEGAARADRAAPGKVASLAHPAACERWAPADTRMEPRRSGRRPRALIYRTFGHEGA